MKRLLLWAVAATFSSHALAQFGAFASAVQLSTDGGTNKVFYNTQKTTGDPNAIGPVNFSGHLGSFAIGENKLLLTGAEVKTFKGSNNNVCGARLQYRVYPENGSGGAFSNIPLGFLAGCSSGVFADGNGPCSGNDQKWQSVSSSINLTAQATQGRYVLELYFDIAGSNSTTDQCGDTTYDSNLGNNYKMTFELSAPLPIVLRQFSGIQQQQQNILSWISDREENFSHYELERSANGHSFQTIGTQKGSANTTLQKRYQFIDKQLTGNTLYYRLKMVDLDGSFSYSSVVQIKQQASAKRGIQVYPNPASHTLNIQQLSKGEKVIVTEASGRVLYQFTAVNGTNTINVAQWAKGTYFVQIVGNKESNFSFVKD